MNPSADTGRRPLRRALLSVSDKTGLVEFARALADGGCELLATGGTHRTLREAGVEVREVSEVTGFPELMDGRVKTLHPLIHAAILARRGIDDVALDTHGIGAIDLVAVNLYPFEKTVAPTEVDVAEAIENIDIGGPAMVRAAAKNSAFVAVVVDPRDYPRVIDAHRRGGTDAGMRRALAVKAFARTARYDDAVAAYLSSLDADGLRAEFPGVLGLQYQLRQTMRYGENPHQQAAFYVDPVPPPGSVATARLLQGKALSFNNVADADAALACVKALPAPACVIVKHANPCGAALSDGGPAGAYEQAYRCDPTSAFGGIVAFNCALDAPAVEAILARQFVEVLVAPRVSDAARDALAAKPNVRVLVTGEWPAEDLPALDFKRIDGGMLVQTRDDGDPESVALQVVSRRTPRAAELADLRFAWTVVRFVKSNAIVLASDGHTLGIGAGQTSRVDAARIAAQKAAEHGHCLDGAVMASDAFFPFRDSVDAAAAAGIRAVIQPGGSIRDEEVIAAADEHGMAMVVTGARHFRH